MTRIDLTFHRMSSQITKEVAQSTALPSTCVSVTRIERSENDLSALQCVYTDFKMLNAYSLCDIAAC